MDILLPYKMNVFIYIAFLQIVLADFFSYMVHGNSHFQKTSLKLFIKKLTSSIDAIVSSGALREKIKFRQQVFEKTKLLELKNSPKQDFYHFIRFLDKAKIQNMYNRPMGCYTAYIIAPNLVFQYR